MFGSHPAATPAFLALSCVGAFATAPAWATEEPKAALTEADLPATDDVLVNGQRIRRPKEVAPLLDTPRSIVVLDKAVIAQTGSQNLQDALRNVPGITFGAAEGGNPIGDRPFIRGFDSQGSIYVDGVRDLASQSREVFAVESVQIVRGSDSTLGGRGSAGGTINILSKQPELSNSGSASASYGNADYKRVTADLNLKLAEHAAFRIEGLWHDQDVAGRDSVYQRRWGVAPSATLGLGTPTRLTVAGYYLQSHELPDSGIPYLYTIGNAPGTETIVSRPAIGPVTLASGQTGYVPRTAFYGLTDRDFRNTKTVQGTIRAEHDFGTLTLRNTARYTHSDQDYIYTQPDDSQGNVYNSGTVWRRGNTRYSGDESIVDQTDLFGTFTTGAIKHSISIGTEFSWEKDRRGTFVAATGSTITPRCNPATIARYYCTSLFSPNPADPWVNYASDTSTVATPVIRGGATTETQNDANTQAIYGFDSITLLPRLILNLGARFDSFTSRTTPPVAAGGTAFSFARTDRLFNWQAGLVFKPAHEASVYASYATAATPPNSLLGEGREDNALPTTTATASILDQLKVQKTKSYEVGAKASLFHEQLALAAAAFQTDISNARVTIDANTVGFLGRTRIRGFELTASGAILPGWTIFGGYTHLDPRIIDAGNTALTALPSSTNGQQVPQTARDSFTATTNVTLHRRLQIGGSAIYMATQIGGYADNRSATQTAAGVVTITPLTKFLIREVPSYWRFDARASFDVTPHVSVSVNAQNLTDKVYFSQAYASHYATIAPGRTVFGTVGLKF